MSQEDYAKRILKTERTDKVDKLSNHFAKALEDFIKASKILDVYKKQLFQSKPYKAGDFSKIDEYKIAEDLSLDVSNISDRQLHAIIGIATEAGEVVEVLTDALTGLKEGEKPELDLVNFMEELGGVDWYSTLASNDMGIYQETYREAMIKQLEFRHGKEGFSTEGCNNRDKKAEQKLLKDCLQSYIDDAKEKKEKDND